MLLISFYYIIYALMEVVMYIGNVEVKGKVVLAPMAGISNSAFRRIAREMGAGLVYAEMVSDKAIFYNNQKTIDMLYMTDEERPISQQIFGCDKESMVVSAKYIYENMKPDIIDINMGCPVPKVAVRAKSGSYLLKDVNKVEEIVSAVVKAVPCPVTVKIRSGWDDEHINAVSVAKAIESAGASAICIHPRTRSQGYSGHSDWSIIKEVKSSVKIPVIGNGDIKDCYSAKKMIDETGCDAVMVGRGLLGNPWLISEINTYLETGEVIDKPSNVERVDMCLKHFNYLLEFQSEKQAVLEIRNHISWYLKGINGANEIKNMVFKTKNKDEIKKILLDFRKVC